jgi:hypothetical protein
MLMAMMLLSKVRAEVDYDNPLYHTGILMGRDTLSKLQNLGFKVKTDSEVKKLFENNPHSILKKIQDRVREMGVEGGE